MDDGVADDAGGDGEYWEEHGKSPLLRVVVLSGSFPDVQLYAKPVPKGKCDFQAKIAGWRIRTICVDGCIYKIVYRNTFSYAMQNKKAPPRRSLKNLQQKRRRLLGGLPRSRSSLAMAFFSLTAPQGERSDHARMGIAEP